MSTCTHVYERTIKEILIQWANQSLLGWKTKFKYKDIKELFSLLGICFMSWTSLRCQFVSLYSKTNICQYQTDYYIYFIFFFFLIFYVGKKHFSIWNCLSSSPLKTRIKIKNNTKSWKVQLYITPKYSEVLWTNYSQF